MSFFIIETKAHDRSATAPELVPLSLAVEKNASHAQSPLLLFIIIPWNF